MVLRVLIGFFGALASLATGAVIVWLTVRNCNAETRRKRGEIALVLSPFFAAALLFILYLISQ